MTDAVNDYYRCAPDLVKLGISGHLGSTLGFFRFGQRNICYGRCAAPVAAAVTNELPDVYSLVSDHGGATTLPFDPTEVVNNFRTEKYTSTPESTPSLAYRMARKVYYSIRPMLPIDIRKHLQRFQLRDWEAITFPSWPVDDTVDRILAMLLTLAIRANHNQAVPFVWFWPDGHSSCALVTHDVEQESGRAFCGRLMDLDDTYGIKSSFQIIPEGRYVASDGLLENIRARGFEVNVHDLNHDGHLFDNRERFLIRAAKINAYAKAYGADGFRAGCTYRNAEWFEAFSFSYDMSVPTVAHLEPQRGGCCTVMPYFIGSLVELPLTTTEDYSLFHILGRYATTLWEEQIERIRASNGLATFIIHPDYILESRPRDVYKILLQHLTQLRSDGKMWLTLPGAVARWWRDRSHMQVVRSARGWEVIGPGSEHARVAFAALDGDQLVYEIDSAVPTANVRARTQAAH